MVGRNLRCPYVIFPPPGVHTPYNLPLSVLCGGLSLLRLDFINRFWRGVKACKIDKFFFLCKSSGNSQQPTPVFLHGKFHGCRGPAWGTPPMAKSWGRRVGIHKGIIKPQETPCSRASNPKTRVCFMLSPTPLILRGALPHNRFSRRRSKRAAPRQ